MEFTPVDPALKRVWELLSPEARLSRFDQAVLRRETVENMLARPPGESERAAAARIAPWAERTAIRKWCEWYQQEGFEGLFDLRLGRPRLMPEEARAAILTLRQSDPNYPVEKIVEHLRVHHDFETSDSSVKRVLNSAGLSRRRGPPSGRGPVSSGEARIELGGMKLLETACLETGYVKALATGIVSHIKDLPRPELPTEPDTSARDEYGRFLPEYNERYRKGENDPIGPGFASVLDKREGLDPARLTLAHSTSDVIERKLLALLAEPLLGTGRFDGLRSPSGALLSEACGFAYMPATLDKMTRELKYAGVASTLWEIHARKWLALNRLWEEDKQLAVLYVDGTSKPVWTDLFSQSAHITLLGKTMPALEHVAFHTGSGVPLWMLTFSGHAPLVKAVPLGLAELERRLGSSTVGRIMVIDAEGNSVPFFKQLERGEVARAWVTRLKESWLKGKRIFNRTNYRAYRNGDRVRVGMCDLNDPDGGKFLIRVVEVERRSSKEVTYLGASVLLTEKEWSAIELADMYFKRWPAQEANFRAVNQAAGLKQVHGYGKRLVSNISVVTELDELKNKRERADARRLKQEASIGRRQVRLSEANRALRGRKWSQKALDRHTQEYLDSGKRTERKGQKLLGQQQVLTTGLAEAEEASATCKKQLEQAQEKLTRTEIQLETYTKREAELQDRREIFAHDVELDSIFALLKVGLVMLVTYVLREYLGDARMEPTTFLERIATLPARIRQLPNLEIVTFEYNVRDPEVMALLAASVDGINARALKTRTGRVLRIAVDPPPPPNRPPPEGKRRNSNDRFKR